MDKLLSVLVIMVLSIIVNGQDSASHRLSLFKEQKSIDIYLGYNAQGNWSDTTGETTIKYLEIGIGKGKYFYHMHGVTGGAIYLSEEIAIGNHKGIYGTKIGCFLHWLFDAGFSIVYYTDFNKGNLKLRPELGVGMGRLRIVAGFNIPTINNKAMPELQKQNAQITIQAGIGIKKREIKQSLK